MWPHFGTFLSASVKFLFQDILGYDKITPEQRASGKLMGDLDIPTVNPLDLPYFMAATFVMSFGLIFLVIATTWLK